MFYRGADRPATYEKSWRQERRPKDDSESRNFNNVSADKYIHIKMQSCGPDVGMTSAQGIKNKHAEALQDDPCWGFFFYT